MIIQAYFDSQFYYDLAVLIKSHGPKKALEILGYDGLHPSFARAAVKKVSRALGLMPQRRRK